MFPTPVSKPQHLHPRGGGRWPVWGGGSSSVTWRVGTLTEGADESWIERGLDCLAGSGASGVTHRTTLVGGLAVTLR
jgi:hypothetical protein